MLQALGLVILHALIGICPSVESPLVHLAAAGCHRAAPCIDWCQQVVVYLASPVNRWACSIASGLASKRKKAKRKRG